jgi:hypothetical protein
MSILFSEIQILRSVVGIIASPPIESCLVAPLEHRPFYVHVEEGHLLSDNSQMIRSVADLLNSLLEKETSLLKEYSSVKHPTIIGDMYEGLTKELLGRAVFEGLGLRVVDGKIRNCGDQLSGQVDCMIVWGDGESIPYTSHYIYPINQVVAVIEVKKNLHSAEIKDAYENLLTVGDSPDSSRYPYTRSAFWHVTGDDIPDDDVNRLAPPRRLLYECLARDTRTPLRIVLGYFGFKGERDLQAAVVQYLHDNLGRKGFGPASLPNLIICEGQAIVKLNGMPYAATLDGDLPGLSNFRANEWWPLYASRRGISLLLLLEILWTRLRQHFVIPVAIFGQDLDIENLNCFLFAKPRPWEGWEYYFYRVSESGLAGSPTFSAWQPHTLETPEFVAFGMLARGEEVRISDPDLKSFLEGEGRSLDDFVERMKATRLVQVEADSGRLVPLAESIVLGVSPQGEFFVDRAGSTRSVDWALKRSRNKSDT